MNQHDSTKVFGDIFVYNNRDFYLAGGNDNGLFITPKVSTYGTLPRSAISRRARIDIQRWTALVGN